MVAEHTFHTGTVELNYAEGEASGPPIVLLHGGSLRWQSVMPLIPDLAARWHVYAPDLRGHGRSGRVPGRYRLQDYASDVALFLEQVVKAPAILFGHSLGGHVAILVAALHPELVRGLVIGDAPFDRTRLRAAIVRDRARLLHWRDLAGPMHSLDEISEGLKQTPIAVDGQPDLVAADRVFGDESPWFGEMAANLHMLDPQMLDAVVEFDQMHADYEYDRLFPLITCPVLIIQGSPAQGGMLTDEEIERALTLLPDATVARMDKVGHPLHMQDKDPVLAALTAFLNTL